MIRPVLSFLSCSFISLNKILTGFCLLLLFAGIPASGQQKNSGLNASSVKLAHFAVTLQSDNSIILKWSTDEEFNVKSFVVEKSYDGSLFKDLVTIFSDGKLSDVHNYQSIDNNIPDAVPVIFYRLRIVDQEGGTRLTEIRSVRTSTPAVMDLAMRIYPNPLKEELRVVIPSQWLQKSIVFEILNINGTLMKRINSLAMTGMETLSLSNLSPAIYMLKATCQGQILSQRIIKE